MSEKSKHFDQISHDFLREKVPFEIRVIFDQSYNPLLRTRYIEFKEEDFHFFTPTSTYDLFIKDLQKGKLFTHTLEPLTLENAQPYFKSYGQGFIKGYHEFDDKVRASTAIFQDRVSVINRVFECINFSIPGLCSYNFGILNGKHVHTVTADLWFEMGEKAGENYKAWYFVLNNSSYFTPLFRSYKPYIKLYQAGVKSWKDAPGGEGMYSRLVKLLKEIGEPIDVDADQENNFLLSTIEDYLSEFKINLTTDDYNRLIDAKYRYFTTGEFPKISKPITFTGKFNRKRLGWSLNSLYRSIKNSNLPAEYLEFGKKHISAFKDTEFDKKNFRRCLLYKYYTTKT